MNPVFWGPKRRKHVARIYPHLSSCLVIFVCTSIEIVTSLQVFLSCFAASLDEDSLQVNFEHPKKLIKHPLLLVCELQTFEAAK